MIKGKSINIQILEDNSVRTSKIIKSRKTDKSLKTNENQEDVDHMIDEDHKWRSYNGHTVVIQRISISGSHIL